MFITLLINSFEKWYVKNLKVKLKINKKKIISKYYYV